MGRAKARVRVIVFGAPFWLLAGGLAALVPLALHLIRRRPPDRAPFPTARFLSDDPRTSLRVSRPTDWLLLALRMTLLVLFGAALARPAWLPSPAGTSELVLLDRGAVLTADGWRDAVGRARRTLLNEAGESRGSLILFDTLAQTVERGRLDTAFFDSLAAAGSSGVGSRYAAALRSIPIAARDLRGADSIRATLISPLRWSAWEAGMTPLRRASWPGALVLEDVRGDVSSSLPAGNPAEKAAVVIAPGDGGRFVGAALEATGWDTRPARSGAIPDGANAYVVMGSIDASDAESLRRFARAGATVVLASAEAVGALDTDAPLLVSRAPVPGGDFRFDDGTSIDGAESGAVGSPRNGARVLAAWTDGRPAAAAFRLDDGCIVAIPTPLEAGGLPMSAAFPRVVDRLVRGCDAPASATVDGPLDAGARAVLRGIGLPDIVSAGAAEGAGGGLPLWRWLVVAAIAVALVETWLAYFRRIQ